jgi:hypothetical protein
VSVSVLNTSASVSGKTLLAAEVAATISGLLTFDRDPSAPFAVSAGSAVVTNLDADKLDGVEGADYARLSVANSFTGTDQTFAVGGDTSIRLVANVNYNLIALNGASTLATTTGIIGGKTGDDDLYINVPTGSDINLRVNSVDYLGLTSTGALWLLDGLAAPATVAGKALIYVDTADGDLKVKFGDGTVKTLATDT